MIAKEKFVSASFNGNWDEIDWSKCQQDVKKLQARIVQATKEGRWNKVKSLQRILTRGFSAKALAVKRVTTNKGKWTPGVDGEIWSSDKKKSQAIMSLRQRGYRVQPLRRIYIPKSNGQKRPLGIPTMKDRAMQALYLMGLEPVAETTGDNHSYGFRAFRGAADANSQIFKTLAGQHRAEWVLEADIKRCFD
jgi:RNA-directed DNA polymerase